MSDYSNDIQKPKQLHNEKIINSRLANPNNNASVDLVNSKKIIDGVDLLYPTSSLVTSTLANSDRMTTVPVSIVLDTSNKSKDIHFDALVDADGAYLTNAELANNTIIDTNSPNGKLGKKGKNEKDRKDAYKNDYIAQFYIGSLTVVGLFILFRLIQKSK
jgi:hypothetical protein